MPDKETNNWIECVLALRAIIWAQDEVGANDDYGLGQLQWTYNDQRYKTYIQMPPILAAANGL